MSLYSPEWGHREAIAVDNTAATSGTVCFSVTIPATWDHFWDHVDADGHDLRVTGADGESDLVFQRDTWDYANRSAVLEVEGFDAGPNAMSQAFLYWGNAAAADGAGTPTISSPLDGHILTVAPSPTIIIRPDRPGATTPTDRVSKKVTDEFWVWWDFRPSLLLHSRPHNGSLQNEEIRHIMDVDVLNGGVSVGSMVDVTLTRIVDGRVGTWLQAGTSGETYTATVRIETTLGRSLEGRALVYVQDPED